MLAALPVVKKQKMECEFFEISEGKDRETKNNCGVLTRSSLVTYPLEPPCYI